MRVIPQSCEFRNLDLSSVNCSVIPTDKLIYWPENPCHGRWTRHWIFNLLCGGRDCFHDVPETFPVTQVCNGSRKNGETCERHWRGYFAIYLAGMSTAGRLSSYLEEGALPSRSGTHSVLVQHFHIWFPLPYWLREIWRRRVGGGLRCLHQTIAIPGLSDRRLPSYHITLRKTAFSRHRKRGIFLKEATLKAQNYPN